MVFWEKTCRLWDGSVYLPKWMVDVYGKCSNKKSHGSFGIKLKKTPPAFRFCRISEPSTISNPHGKPVESMIFKARWATKKRPNLTWTLKMTVSHRNPLLQEAPIFREALHSQNDPLRKGGTPHIPQRKGRTSWRYPNGSRMEEPGREKPVVVQWYVSFFCWPF